MKKVAAFFLIIASCSKNNDKQTNEFADMIIGNSWRVHEYISNGVTDPTTVSRQETYEFRSDGKIYFSQINPAYKDTLNYRFLNSKNIKVTKPSISTSVVINFQVDKIDNTSFDFTVTSNENGDIDKYKSHKL